MHQETRVGRGSRRVEGTEIIGIAFLAISVFLGMVKIVQATIGEARAEPTSSVAEAGAR
ncbi:MAG: hypothetical protein QOD06_2022 [Candidatus Binatota bacterium]|jgi:hypothetical protein|nr:hypothetical protein [Candidatus Binatota bacterium]